MKKKQSLPHEPGECQICADKGSRPAEAIACAWHSVYTIKELQAEIAVLKDTASASSRLHLALAELYGFVPSTDGQDELNAVREDHARMDRVRDAIEHALAIANYDDEPVSSPPSPSGWVDDLLSVPTAFTLSSLAGARRQSTRVKAMTPPVSHDATVPVPPSGPRSSGTQG